MVQSPILVYGDWASAAVCAHQIVVPYVHPEFGRQRARQNEIFLELVVPGQVEMAVAVSWLVFEHQGSA